MAVSPIATLTRHGLLCPQALGSDDLVLEVSFAYAAAPQDGSIDCSGVTGTLGGLATAVSGSCRCPARLKVGSTRAQVHV